MRLDHNEKPLFFVVDNSANTLGDRKGFSILRRVKSDDPNGVGAYEVVRVFGRNAETDACVLCAWMNTCTHDFDAARDKGAT